MRLLLIFLGLAAAHLAGCATSVRPHPAMEAAGFRPLAGDDRVWFEPGAEGYAQRVADHLDLAIFRVESLHGRPFRSPPRVHVCGSAECFARLVRTPGLSAAVVPDNRLILSPRLDGQEAHRLSGILTHELSHVHLGQYLGHYTPWLPVWFHEGLATLAAEGAGAEYASDETACSAWQEGRRVDVGGRDTPDRRLRANDFGLTIHEFYRQSWRLVERLQEHDPAAFRRWLDALLDEADFHIAFADAYNTGLTVLSTVLFNPLPVHADQARHE